MIACNAIINITMILRFIAIARKKVLPRIARIRIARMLWMPWMARSRILWVFAGLIIAFIFLLPLASHRYQNTIIQVITRYPYVAPVTIIFFRIMGIILAPLPGAPVALASLALLPWWLALLYNFIGTTSGMIGAFWIARIFRDPVVARFASLQYVHQWQEKISQKKQFFAFIALRLSALVALDFISYAAGLTKIPFRTFLLATLAVDIPINFLFYYVGGKAISYSIAVLGGAGIISILFIFIFLYVRKFKKTA